MNEPHCSEKVRNLSEKISAWKGAKRKIQSFSAGFRPWKYLNSSAAAKQTKD